MHVKNLGQLNLHIIILSPFPCLPHSFFSHGHLCSCWDAVFSCWGNWNWWLTSEGGPIAVCVGTTARATICPSLLSYWISARFICLCQIHCLVCLVQGKHLNVCKISRHFVLSKGNLEPWAKIFPCFLNIQPQINFNIELIVYFIPYPKPSIYSVKLSYCVIRMWFLYDSFLCVYLNSSFTRSRGENKPLLSVICKGTVSLKFVTQAPVISVFRFFLFCF